MTEVGSISGSWGQHNPWGHLLALCLSREQKWVRLSQRLSVFISVGSLSALEDLAILCGLGYSLKSRIASYPSLLCIVDRRFPLVIHTGHAFLSPEKIVKLVASDFLMVGTRVPPYVSVSSDMLGYFHIKEATQQYSGVLLLVSHMHFCTRSLSSLVVFTTSRIEKGIKIRYVVKKISYRA